MNKLTNMGTKFQMSSLVNIKVITFFPLKASTVKYAFMS